MKVQDYLKDAEGFGIMTTVDSSGRPNAAVYSKPHVMDDDTIAFIMLERLTHNNLKSNPSAAYLFLENHETGGEFKGLRMYLTKLREEKNTALLNKLRRVKYSSGDDQNRYLVFFKIEKVLPLVGGDRSSIPFEK